MSDSVMPACAGHFCDGCRVCQRGRCCRQDNPHYRLPDFGDWDGPIYGRPGVLEDDGERARCHCCGEFYAHLGSHVSQKHDLTPAEYKAVFGLNATTGLIGPALRSKRAESARRRRAGGSFDQDLRVARKRLTDEQRAAYHVGRKIRLEQRLRPKDPEAIRRGAETRKRRYAAGEIKPGSPWLDGPPREVVEKSHARQAELRTDPAWRAAWIANVSRAARERERRRADERASTNEPGAVPVPGPDLPGVEPGG